MEKVCDNLGNESLGVDMSAISNMIWSTADTLLRGIYKSDRYKDIIIPMVLIRRFECALEETKESVIEFYKENVGDGELEDSDKVLLSKSITELGYYNTCEYTLETLIAGHGNLWEKFEMYLDGFSDDINAILEHLEFRDRAYKIYCNHEDRFRNILKTFAGFDLGKNVSNTQMGYLFEDLIRRFSENAEAGDHYTPREVIHLMCELVLNDTKKEEYSKDGRVVKVYDGTCGTGGMLVNAYDKLKKYNKNLDVRLYGQEINAESYAIAKADMLINQHEGDIALHDTLLEDMIVGTDGRREKVDLAIMNPPFGINWDTQYEEVVYEHEYMTNGRFPAGLPAKSDGALLFLQHMVSKLSDAKVIEHSGEVLSGGRGLIVHNGSPLFSGKAGSGESEIRRWLLENDYLEGIVALPTDMFYNTGIATYIWVISKEPKEERRKGKVQLLDARGYATKMRKALGSKRNELTSEAIQDIAKLYHSFGETDISKIYDNESFLYWQVDINQPFQRNFAITEDRIVNLSSATAFNKLHDEAKYEELIAKDVKKPADLKKIAELEEGKKLQDTIINNLAEEISDEVYKNRNQFEDLVTTILSGLGIKPALMSAIIMSLSEQDTTVEKCYDAKGRLEIDKELKDTEIIPCVKGIGEVVGSLGGIPVCQNQVENYANYLEREVVPHCPNAIPDKKSIKVGAEIPFTRLFYKYEDTGSFKDYMEKCKSLEGEITKLLEEVFA